MGAGKGALQREKDDEGQREEGVFYKWNDKTHTLVVDAADQELEVLTLPRSIASLCDAAVTVDVSGNRLVGLEHFENFSFCETLLLDGNELREECVALSDGSALLRVRTLSLNKNRIRDVRLLAVNIAQTFPNVAYLSLLWNPCAPVNDGPEYERMRRLLIYKLPSLRVLDSRAVTREEKALAERDQAAAAASQLKGKEEASDGGGPVASAADGLELKRDAEQARLVRQAKKDVLAKNRSVSTSSIRQSAGLAQTSAAGLVKAGPNAALTLLESSSDDETGRSDDTSEVAEQSPRSETGGSERRSYNLAATRSISLSGKKLEEHFQYAKPQPAGKLVDREGWLTMRLKKTRWKRCWFVLKGGALFRFRTPEDELYIEQIIVSEASVERSENRKGNCFKIEKAGEKLVFKAEDSWDQASWIVELQKWSVQQDPSAAAAAAGAAASTGDKPKRKFSFSKK